MQFGTKTCLSLLIAFLFTWVGLRLILPLTAPFLFGAALALAAEPMTGLLRRKLHLPRALCAGIGVSAAFFFFSKRKMFSNQRRPRNRKINHAQKNSVRACRRRN